MEHWISQMPFNFEDMFASENQNNSNEENTDLQGSHGNLLQGMENRDQFITAPIGPYEFPTQNMDFESPYNLTIPPGFSPGTLLDSIAQPSANTGNFSHVPNGGFQSNFASSSTLVPQDNHLRKDDFFWDQMMNNASSFALNPITESDAHLFGVSNEVTLTNVLQPSYGINQVSVQPDAGYLPQTSYGINQISVQPDVVHPPQSLGHFNYNIPEHVPPPQSMEQYSNYNTLQNDQQHMGLSEMDALGVNAYDHAFGANLEEYNALDEQQQDRENSQRGNIGEPNTDHIIFAEDGYSWIKYDQKQVIGSEHPREYYKCSYPGCPVKKKVETSTEGHINDIQYQGLHNHPVPLQPGHDYSFQSSLHALNNMLLETENQDGAGTSTFTGGDPVWNHDNGNMDMSLNEQNGIQLNSGEENDDHVTNGSVSVGFNGAVGDESASNERKTEISSEPAIRPMRGPRVVVQTTSDVDIIDDGYRSYYKCTTVGCLVRKHIERASHDLTMVVTTYDGIHNHEVPAPRNNSHNYTGVYVINPPHPQLGSFPMSARPPLGSTYQGSGYGLNLRGSSNKAIGGMQPNRGEFPIYKFLTQQGPPNQGQLPVLPVNQFLTQQGQPNQGQLHVLPDNQFLGQQGQSNQGQLPVLPGNQFLGQQGSQPNQGQLPVLPFNQFLDQQDTMMNVGSQMLPQEEPNVQHTSNPGLTFPNSSSMYHNQDMSTNQFEP